jgi:hypothetical protein
MNSDTLTAYRQFEIDTRQENAEALVTARKEDMEEEATQELYATMGNTLADFQTWPSWVVEKADANTETSDTHIYSLTMKVVFKP